MTVALDTSVVLCLLIGEPAEQSAAAWDAIAAQPTGGALVSDLVVSEAYFAVRHHYGVPHGEAIAALSGLLADSRVHATGVAPTVLPAARNARGGAGLMDRLIHADYVRDGGMLLTFDRTAAALTGAQLLGG